MCWTVPININNKGAVAAFIDLEFKGAFPTKTEQILSQQRVNKVSII